jgi:rhamnosyltransferase
MATTKLNILFDVVFNREVGDNRGLYFNSESGNLKSLINQVELFDSNKIEYYGRMNKNIISSKYTWEKVVESTEKAFNEIYINFGVR